jgi:hypothetical protein
MQGRIPTYKKSEYSKHTKEKTLHIEFYVQKYGRKKYFYLKKILLSNPQKEKPLNTYKKDIKNGGTSN